jgi:hypothetical protein
MTGPKKKGITVGIKTEWVQQPGDGTPCKTCNDPIYGNMYCLETTVFTKTELSETKFCESCYYKIDR